MSRRAWRNPQTRRSQANARLISDDLSIVARGNGHDITRADLELRAVVDVDPHAPGERVPEVRDLVSPASAAKARRTISTFSGDIARPVSRSREGPGHAPWLVARPRTATGPAENIVLQAPRLVGAMGSAFRRSLDLAGALAAGPA